MLKKLKRLFYKYFDYYIVGDYLDSNDGCHYKRKYIRKYYLKCFKKKKKRGGKR